MRFGLLTQWFDPEPGPAALPGGLARSLQQRGHDVQVITAFPNYPHGRVFDGYHVRPRSDEVVDGLNVRRTAVYANHGSSAVRRFASYASFGLSSSTYGLGAMRDLDAMWVNFSPITLSWPMWAAAARHSVPSVVHVLDLWPDTVMHSGFQGRGKVGNAAWAAMSAWCSAGYRSSDSVAYISPSVGDVLEQRGVPANKLHYVPMWADEASFSPNADDTMRAAFGIDPDEIVFLYAGAMGDAQGLESLIQAASRTTHPKLRLVLAGSGIRESDLRARADALGTTKVSFVGRVPQTEMSSLLGAADLSVVSLRSHPMSDLTMPSKTQAALASGKPILAAATGDVARVVADEGVGFAANPADIDGVARVMDDAAKLGRSRLADLGRYARSVYDREFSLAAGTDRIEALLMKAADRRTRNT